MDASLYQFAKAGAPRAVEPGDLVRIDQEPHFAGVVKAMDGMNCTLVECRAGLFLAPLDEISILRRAA